MFKTGIKKLIVDLALLTPFILFLFFRLDGIFTDMSNSDAARWHRRSEDFAVAMKTRDFAATYQSYHPGVTLMWLSAGVELGIKQYAVLTNSEFKTLENTDGYLLIDGVSKTILVFVLLGLLILQFKYIDALFDREVAFIYTFLIAIEPYYIGINRWFHLTSIETSLAFTSFLALLLWADARQRGYLAKSAFLLALAVLTKFSSLSVVPIFVAVMLITMFKDKTLQKSVYIKDFVKFGVIFIVTIFALFPALWTTPVEVFSKLLSAGSNAAGGDYSAVAFAEKYPLVYYFVATLFKLSPVTLIIFVVALIKTFIWKEWLVLYILGFAVSTFVILSVSEQKIERYILVYLPAVLLICSITLARVSSSLRLPAILTAIAFTFLIFKNYHPVYSSYYSPAFGGAKNAFALGLYDDNGEYFAKAALYLNQKGRDIHVHVPFNTESFTYYFKGKFDTELTMDTDYILISNDTRRSVLVPSITYAPHCANLEKVYYNYNFSAVQLYKCDKSIFSEPGAQDGDFR